MAQHDNPIEDIFGPVIHAVTRQDLLQDGILVDVSLLARQAGFTIPVAVGRSVWEAYVEVPPGVDGQDPTGRLWDILWMLRCHIRLGSDGSSLLFSLSVRNDRRPPRRVQLKALCGPGDQGEPVITILLPHED